MVWEINLAVTDLRSSIYLVYIEEFRGDPIKDCKYLQWEEVTTVREPFKFIDKDTAGS